MITAIAADLDARRLLLVYLALITLLLAGAPMARGQELQPAELVQAGGAAIDVPGYSVPSMADWNNDGLPDLIVGEGDGYGHTPKVRVYINEGSAAAPAFSTWTYAQAQNASGDSADLTAGGIGCMGLFPRLTDWNADGLPDMLVGESGGRIKVYNNVGDSGAPAFDAGTTLEVGPADAKAPISVGSRATPSVVDWNNDGRQDMICGAYDGKLRLFINEGLDGEPDFLDTGYVQAYAGDLSVGGLRASPSVVDLDGDGKKDLVVGDSYGYLRFYRNIGLDEAPAFGGYAYLFADGARIDLPGYARSRPSVCDWTGDGRPDLLVGGGDGQVYLFQSVPEPAGLTILAAGALAALRRRRR